MEKTYTIKEIYHAVKLEEEHKDFCREHFGPDSDEYDTAVSWYCACETMFFAITGKHYPEYKKEVGDDI